MILSEFQFAYRYVANAILKMLSFGKLQELIQGQNIYVCMYVCINVHFYR